MKDHISHNGHTAGGSFEAERVKRSVFFLIISARSGPGFCQEPEYNCGRNRCSPNKYEFEHEINVTFCVAARNIWFKLSGAAPAAGLQAWRAESSCPASLPGWQELFFFSIVFKDLQLHICACHCATEETGGESRGFCQTCYFYRKCMWVGVLFYFLCFLKLAESSICISGDAEIQAKMFAGMCPLTSLCRHRLFSLSVCEQANLAWTRVSSE